MSVAASPWIEVRLDGFEEPSAPLDSLGSSLSVLSFRVAKVLPAEIPFYPFPGDALGVEAACQAFIATQDLSDLVVRVTLSDADGGTSAPLSSAVYQRVAAPRIGVETATIKPAVVCAMNTFWTTVRIPLTEFVGVDLGRLERLRIAVDPAENGNGQFTTLLDSVELLGHVLDPVCGNGALEAGEFCDGDDLGGSTCLTLGEGDGELACEAGCTFDVSDCILPGECQFDTPGCPGGPCLEVPDSTGVAAYFQDGRYCNDVTSVCREDNPGVWTCHDCSSMLDNRVGCPCLPNSLECPPGLGCFGTPPDLPGIDVGARGACWMNSRDRQRDFAAIFALHLRAFVAQQSTSRRSASSRTVNRMVTASSSRVCLYATGMRCPPQNASQRATNFPVNLAKSALIGGSAGLKARAVWIGAISLVAASCSSAPPGEDGDASGPSESGTASLPMLTTEMTSSEPEPTTGDVTTGCETKCATHASLDQVGCRSPLYLHPMGRSHLPMLGECRGSVHRLGRAEYFQYWRRRDSGKRRRCTGFVYARGPIAGVS
jgi:hypothetical protein